MIEVTHVPSKKQHADILTKALPRDLFEVHRDFALGSRDKKYKVESFFFSLIYIFGLVDTTAPRESVRDSGRVYRLSCGRISDWMILIAELSI